MYDRVIRPCRKARLRWALIPIAIFSLGSLPSAANSKGRYKFDTFEIRDSQFFSNYNSVVGQYLRKNSRQRQTRACVVGQKIAGQQNETAWVIWRGGNTLILWWGGGNDDLSRSNRILSLTRDVVANDAAVGTSTYLVSRQWVAMVEQKCARFGRNVTIN